MNLFLRFPNGVDKALTLSYDDGVFQDIRLSKILSDKGIKCTFNVNSAKFGKQDAQGGGRLSVKQAKELYINSIHEVAVHSSTHPFLEELPVSMVTNEVLQDRKNSEEMFGTIVRGMAYPYGTYSDEVVKALECAGIAYSRTTASTFNFSIPTDWLRMPATCHHNDPRLNELCEKFLGENRFGKPKLFYLWGHSYEFDNNDNWNIIEEFAEKMGSRDDVWYATNIEVYDYVVAYKRLIFSVESRKVYNPNAQPVWFSCDGTVVKVESGDTKIF